MEIQGKIHVIKDTQTFGSNGFKKREMVLTTNEQYPQMILIEFVQDKCDILDKYQPNDEVKININIRGREWINPKGEAVYFNSLEGWRIEKNNDAEISHAANVAANEINGDSPNQ